MVKNASFALVLLLILCACSGSEITLRRTKGGKYYGGSFRFMSPEKVNNLLPVSSPDIYTQRINNQLFETLLRLDMDSMKVSPGLANFYKIDKEARKFTFRIREGIYFHPDPCFGNELHEMTARDIKFTLDLACSGLKENKIGYLLTDRIQGARSFQARSKKFLPKEGVSGIRVLDDYTLEITLVQTFNGFDKILCHASLGIVSKEAFEKYGTELGNHPLGTGPFMLDKKDKNGIVLKRNPNYWRKDEFGKQLPFLDKIQLLYVKDKRSELMAFRKKQIDIVLDIPVDEIENALGSLKEAQAGLNVKHKVESNLSMSMNYIAFANESIEFRDWRVRQAFNLAVDREKIVNHYLKGEGWPANHGFIPSTTDYQVDDISGIRFDLAKARSLLAQAGYDNGKGFPTIDFYVNALKGSTVHTMCEGIARELKKNLNIDLRIKLCTIRERNRAILSGKAKLWRSGWIADYPDAENFLSLFYGKNIKSGITAVNAFRFRDTTYDRLYELLRNEINPKKRSELYTLCDQIIVDKSPVMPILTDDFIVMVNVRVRALKTNPMEQLDFSSVFIREPRN